MGWEADLLDAMRSPAGEEADGKAGGIQLAVMTGPTSCRIGKLELASDDLLFSDRLISPTAVSVAGQCPAAGGALKDQSKYLPALAAGDQVAVYRVSDSQYLVLGKMVSV